jgi:hypothetical protein
MAHWVMDYETLINCFTAVFTEYKTGETKVFVVHSLRNDYDAFLRFIHEHKSHDDYVGEYHISYNGLNFDAQITEFLLREGDELSEMEPERIAHTIYLQAQHVIELSNAGEFPEFPERALQIPQLDVFRLNHWDNPAKRSSLKWIEFSMDWDNVRDMPIHHSTYVQTMQEIDTIVNYCVNDVAATKRIMELSQEQIMLRKTLTAEYKINLMSASEPKISKELFLYFLSKKTCISKFDLKQMRTPREQIVVADIILPYITFKRKEFINIHEKFKSLIINTGETKGGFKYSITHKGVKTDFGLGGVHGATKAGVYEAKDGMIIMTSDVTSFYPNLAIRNKWSPEHIPQKEFCEQYEWFFDERKKIPKKDPKNYVYKIILNSTYGLSNDENSFLYDPEFTMRITINGQLSLAMLYEMLSDAIPGSIPLMQNTDGLEMMIPAHMRDVYLDTCKKWEDMTMLQLEHDEYEKMIIGDVNNYIAVLKSKEVSYEDYEAMKKKTPHYVYTMKDGKYYYNATKCKGRFEFSDLALHKNKSALIVPKAIYNYFVKDVVPEKFIQENRSIFDYCKGVKRKGDWFFLETCFAKGQRFNKELQGIVRYYISNKGCKIIKVNSADGREVQVEAGKWMQTEFNLYENKTWNLYDVNDDYYLDQVYKEIEKISKKKEKSQLSLF